MPRAVKFTRYGGPEVLEIHRVPRPQSGPGEVLVRIAVAPVDPGEAGIRQGVLADIWPAYFPEGQGNDFAGRAAALGEGVEDFTIGDEVVGYLPALHRPTTPSHPLQSSRPNPPTSPSSPPRPCPPSA